jgi:hypothetical protein
MLVRASFSDGQPAPFAPAKPSQTDRASVTSPNRRMNVGIRLWTILAPAVISYVCLQHKIQVYSEAPWDSEL